MLWFHNENSMVTFESFKRYLRCPNCHSSTLSVEHDTKDIVCGACGSRYPISFQRPVLLRSDNDLFHLNDYRNAKKVALNDGGQILSNLMPSPSLNLSSEEILLKVRELLEEKTLAIVLVVGGGCQRKWLNERLGCGKTIQVVYSDIDINADVDLFCDGHELPFVDGSFDAVVTTAVLEHVLYPERVAAEITRVLKTNGLLYSELPFMQQVHEGAYDFTRYTLSGHRRLFNHISEIESGMVAGPGTALVWAIENFALAFFEKPLFRKIIKIIIRIFFGWIKYFDLLLKNKPAAMDGASCTYLFGRKTEEKITDDDIIARSVGAKHMKHV